MKCTKMNRIPLPSRTDF
ncbi:MAG: tetracycline resistance efflux system leader peptide [Niastella sp.]